MFLTLLQVTSSNWSDSERRTHGHQVRGPVAVYKFQKLWNKLETMIRTIFSNPFYVSIILLYLPRSIQQRQLVMETAFTEQFLEP